MKENDPQQALKILATRIKEAREAAHLTQTQLAKLIGVSKQAVSRWEAAVAPPLVTNMLKLSALLKFDLAKLFAELSDDIALQDFAERRISAASKLLPLYGSEEQCGAVLMGLEVVDPKRFIASPMPHGTKDVAYTVTSRANEPKIHLGDSVTLRVGALPEPRQFVFACVRGKFIMRRYLPKSSTTHVGAILRAENVAFPDETMAEEDQVLGVLSEYSSHSHD